MLGNEVSINNEGTFSLQEPCGQIHAHVHKDTAERLIEERNAYIRSNLPTIRCTMDKEPGVDRALHNRLGFV